MASAAAAVSQRASEAAVQRLPRRLLLHVARVVGEEVRAARADGDQLLAVFADARRASIRYEKDRGYVCTFSALVVKSNTAHLFHVGDARIYRLRDGTLEQLTEDHRLWVSQEQSYLSRALGVNSQLEHRLPVAAHRGGRRVLVRDRRRARVRERARSSIERRPRPRGGSRCRGARHRRRGVRARQHRQPDRAVVRDRRAAATGRRRDPAPADGAAVSAGARAAHGVRRFRDRARAARQRPQPRVPGDGSETGAPVVIKTLATDMREDAAYLERFLMEDWIAQRIDNAHVVRAAATRPQAQLPLHGERVRRRPDTAPVDHRQPEAAGRRRAPHRRADRATACRPFTGSRCCTRTCGRRTS